MNKTYEYFLQLLKSSLQNQKLQIQLSPKYEEILKLASIHKVVPLIYESAYKTESFKQQDTNLSQYFKTASMQIVYSQIQRSERFLQLYKEFNKAKVKVLVFKGIILRELYPIPDERISGDEDLLINSDKTSEIKDLANIFSSSKLNDMIRIVEETRNTLKNNVNSSLAFITMVLRMQEV